MKNTFAIISFLIFILMSLTSNSTAQNNTVDQTDSIDIKQTALNYIDGFYSGDVIRMEKAIHPDINKATPRDLPQTGRTILTYTTYSGLIEFTRAKLGVVDDSIRNIKIDILNIDNDVANVKISSANFIDFVQMVKLDGQWKIVNVLYTSGTGVAPRFKDFKIENEKAAIEQIAMDYLVGMTGSDAKCLEMAIDPEFSKITLNPIPGTGKVSFRRQRYVSIIENALARVGKQDEIYRNNSVTVLDIADGIAIVKCEMVTTYEYVQMFKSSGEWKILNSIFKQNNSLTLAQVMAVIVGDPMPDFSLPIHGGGNFPLSKYIGKNVLLMFPRGKTGNNWCAYCPYQYLELEQLEKDQNIEKKNNLKIAFVLPYSSEEIKDWMEKFPTALQTVEAIKNQEPAPALGSLQSDYMMWARNNFPIKFDVKKEDQHITIPVLVDENRTLSRQLKIFTGFWDGITSEQNMASVFIIDKKGILKFKYIGQMTEDRPSVEFLLNFIKNME
ncbi:MAG: nuclear transport factor 2 family protein [bacterium]